jgi:DNA modification methylase
MNKVYFGDCRDSMRQMAKEGIKVQTCITSPPYYGLRDYGHEGQIGNEQTPQEFIDNLVEVFACVWDILADDGTLWVNLGDTYSAGGRGAGSEVQKANKGSITGNVLGTWKVEGYRPKNLLGMPWRLAFALQDFGWNLRQDIIWHKPNPMPESVTDRCTKAHEYFFLLSKSQKYYFDYQSIKEEGVIPEGTKAAKGSEERQNQKGVNARPPEYKIYDGMRNKRSVWTVNTSSYKGAHFATYPPELIEPCILAGSRVGDIVLDPFFGSGTTGMVAQNLGRKWIGCELNTEYQALQNERLQQTAMELI